MPYSIWAKEETDALKKVWPLYLKDKIDNADLGKIFIGRSVPSVRCMATRIGLPAKGRAGRPMDKAYLAKLLSGEGKDI